MADSGTQMQCTICGWNEAIGFLNSMGIQLSPMQDKMWESWSSATRVIRDCNVINDFGGEKERLKALGQVANLNPD
jgi:hypothetical protein